MPPRDWNKERRKTRLRAHGGEPATEGGLPPLPRFGNLRDAAKLPRGRRERRAFSPHVAQQLRRSSSQQQSKMTQSLCGSSRSGTVSTGSDSWPLTTRSCMTRSFRWVCAKRVSATYVGSVPHSPSGLQNSSPRSESEDAEAIKGTPPAVAPHRRGKAHCQQGRPGRRAKASWTE